jgi:hypothetical protein
MRHLSAIVLIAFVILLPSCKFFKGIGLFGKKADTLAVWQARQDSIRVVDSIRTVQEQLLAIENAKLEAAKKAAEELALKSKFNIIVGSFKTPEYAKGLAEVYRQKGYPDTKIIKMEGSTFELVSAEAHESVRKAVSRQKEFQANVEPDAWIYIIK